MNYNEEAMRLHAEKKGKLEIASRVPLETKDDLSIAYTPGVAAPCLAIAKEPSRVWELTMKGRSVAIVTDGSAILGLGNIGPEAGLPVMEGKAIIYKRFADVDAWPICLATQDVNEIVQTVKHIAPGFGAVHLEDISAPRCFEIEERLERELGLPVVHDDQHATAIVILAGLMNAFSIVGKQIENVRVVISGAGAAGLATANLLMEAGVRHIRVLDSKGVITPTRNDGMNAYKMRAAEQMFMLDAAIAGDDLRSVLRGADVFIGVSQPNLLFPEDIKTMASKAIVFAMSNPIPEIMPSDALAGGAAVVASGRSDFPNQVNNALVYPGLFLGLLESRVPQCTTAMKLAAARAVAAMVLRPTADEILPTLFHGGLVRTVADAVQAA